jgi:simple sugar transport system ATP-binding protein
MLAVKVDRVPFSKHGILQKGPMYELTRRLIEKFDIRPANPVNPTSALSGGNAQKVVVAREVDAGGELLIAAQPSRGVDIGAVEFIQSILNEEKAKGKGILLVSADLEEIFRLSDRIVVMYEGRITGSMPTEEATQEKVGLLMMGRNEGAAL